MVDINDLDYDLLTYLLTFLSNKQLFQIESVCWKWKKCVNKIMKRITEFHAVNFGSFFRTNQRYEGSWQYIIHHHNIDKLKIILSKCNQIKHIDFSETFITGNVLLAFGNGCTQLESIVFEKYLDVDEEAFEQFAIAIGPKLIRCSFINLYYKFDKNLDFIQLIVKHFKNIEEIEIAKSTQKDDEKIFHYLNSCENLKKIKWKSLGVVMDYQIEIIQPLYNVFQRINCLDIDFDIFIELEIEMNNLTELIINRENMKDAIGSSIIISSQPKSITFNNLEKITIHRISNANLYFMSKFKFPKLQYFNGIFDYLADNDTIQSFFNQIKNLKTLEINYYYDLKLIKIFDNLVNLKILTYVDEDNYNEMIELLDFLTQYHSLQQINVKFLDYHLNVEIFDKIINLCNAKPNCQIEIFIYIWLKSPALEEYKLKYEQTKHLVNVKLSEIVKSSEISKL